MTFARLLLVASSVAGSAVKNMKYTKTFASTDWTSGSTSDTLTIAAATHGKGTDIVAQVWVKNGNDYVASSGYPSVGVSISCASTGDITISTDAGDAFDGKIVILG